MFDRQVGEAVVPRAGRRNLITMHIYDEKDQ